MRLTVRTPTIGLMKHIVARRAFTLLELVITMSITIVMMVMVVSFSIMCNNWARLGTARYDLLNTERLTRSAITQFLSYYDCSDYYLTTDTTALAVHNASDGLIVCRMVVEEDNLVFASPDGEECKYNIDSVDSVRFALEQSPINGNGLLCVYLNYTLPSASKAGKEMGTLSLVAAVRAMGVLL